MGFGFGNAIASVRDPHIRACLERLGRSHVTDNLTLSTLVRNNVSTSDITAGAGLTGGGALNSETSVTLNVGAGTGITVNADSISISSSYLGANPTATIGLAAVNGTATTYMRSDAAPPLNVGIVPTWTGIHTFSAQDVHNAGVSLGTSGSFVSAVADAAAVSFALQPSVALTDSVTPDRYIFELKNSAGAAAIRVGPLGSVYFSVPSPSGSGLVEVGTTATALSRSQIAYGVKFGVKWADACVGLTLSSIANSVAGAYFSSADNVLATSVQTLIGGYFTNLSVLARNHTNIIGGMFKASEGGPGAGAHGNIYGCLIKSCTAGSIGTVTATNAYGLYIENAIGGAKPNTTNYYGAYIAEQTHAAATIRCGLFMANATAGYKAIAIRDLNTAIGADASGELTLTFDTTNLVSYDDDLVLYGDELVRY